MAKLKKMNDTDLKALAAKLIDTNKNVYEVAKSMGFAFTETEWAKMEKQEKLFKCEECNQWLPATENVGSEICQICDEEIMVEEDDDE